MGEKNRRMKKDEMWDKNLAMNEKKQRVPSISIQHTTKKREKTIEDRLYLQFSHH